MLSRRLWGPVGAIMLSACGNSEHRDVVVRRDGAGVEIVESHEALWTDGDEWNVFAEPLLDLAVAGSGPEHEFFRVRNAIRLTDGRVVVANSGTNEVRFYDADGHFLRSTGRTGQGPGEFERLTSVRGYRADSLIAFDYWGRRVSVMDATGEIVRVTSLTMPAGSFRDLHALPGGAFLLHANTLAVMEEARGRIRIPAPLLKLNADGIVEDTVAVVPGFETYVFESGDVAPPFYHQAWVTAHDSRIYVGDGNSFEISVFDLAGDVRSVIRLPRYDQTVPASIRDSIRVAMLQQELPPEIRPTFEAMASSIPERRPAYSGITVDPLGFVWVHGYVTSSGAPGPRHCEIFDSTGVWLGTVSLPDNFNLYQVGEDYVVGGYRDELGVETIRVLGLDRS